MTAKVCLIFRGIVRRVVECSDFNSLKLITRENFYLGGNYSYELKFFDPNTFDSIYNQSEFNKALELSKKKKEEVLTLHIEQVLLRGN